MSLLLEALRRAERARGERATGDRAANVPPAARAAAALMGASEPRTERARLAVLVALLSLTVVGMGVYFYLAVFMPWVFSPEPPPPAPAPTAQTVDSPSPAQAPLAAAAPAVARLPGPLPAASPASPSVADAPDTIARTLTRGRRAMGTEPGSTARREKDEARAVRVESHPQRSRPSHAEALGEAYRRLSRGDLEGARQAYEALAVAHPEEAEVWVGLAHIAERQGRRDAAAGYYARALARAPDHAYARARLTSLVVHGAQGETELEDWLSRAPSADLFAALGNLYAAQNRWREAQAAYFEAQRLAPDDADHAYNLAVSLEHLGERRAALEYYRRALAAAEKRGASFDREAAAARAALLER